MVRDKLKCGECGGDIFRLIHESEPDHIGRTDRVGGSGSGGFDGTIVVICQGCHRESRIEPVPAKLTTDAGSTLSGGWR